MKRVLFVCMGNICRSPAAEGVFQARIEDGGLEDHLAVDSAGTIGYHTGDRADGRMREAAACRGYTLESRARQVTSEDLEAFDLVIAMDRENLADLQSLAADPSASVRLFSDFLPPGSPRDVPDPYYGGAAGFERVLDLLEEGCPRIVEILMEPGGR